LTLLALNAINGVSYACAAGGGQPAFVRYASWVTSAPLVVTVLCSFVRGSLREVCRTCLFVEVMLLTGLIGLELQGMLVASVVLFVVSGLFLGLAMRDVWRLIQRGGIQIQAHQTLESQWKREDKGVAEVAQLLGRRSSKSLLDGPRKVQRSERLWAHCFYAFLSCGFACWCTYPVVALLSFVDVLGPKSKMVLFFALDCVSKGVFVSTMHALNVLIDPESMRERAAKRERLREADNKDQFLAYIVHEVRVPLNSLALAAESLKETVEATDLETVQSPITMIPSILSIYVLLFTAPIPFLLSCLSHIFLHRCTQCRSPSYRCPRCWTMSCLSTRCKATSFSCNTRPSACNRRSQISPLMFFVSIESLSILPLLGMARLVANYARQNSTSVNLYIFCIQRCGKRCI
jgi:hypothetical protein